MILLKSNFNKCSLSSYFSTLSPSPERKYLSDYMKKMSNEIEFDNGKGTTNNSMRIKKNKSKERNKSKFVYGKKKTLSFSILNSQSIIIKFVSVSNHTYFM